MNRRSIAVICRQRIVELTHPQGTPLDIVLSLGPGMAITESTVFRADLQTARFPASAPLARTADVTAAPGATGPWTLALSGAQLNQTVTGESRRFWLPVYGVVAGTRVEPLVGIVITLTANNISSLAPPPPVEPIYLTEASASDLYAALADFENLADRVTSLESNEGGGAQADWSATSGPSQILNKPPLGNSASRNVGTGAGDVATGNHGHTTSQITGLDTALAAKADLSGGKLLASQLPDLAITQWLGTVANQSAMLALVGQRGDWCARTDDGKVYIVTGEPSSSIGNWTSLAYPTAPVQSVAGRTGSITLGIGDISGLQGVLDVKVNSDALLALAFRDTIGSGQIDDGAVTNGKLSVMAAATLKGSIAGGTPADLTATQVTALLNTFATSLKGLAPASGGGTTNFLRADGTWAAPPGGSAGGSGSELQFRNGGAFGAVANSTVTESAISLQQNLELRSATATSSNITAPVLQLTGSAWNGSTANAVGLRIRQSFTNATNWIYDIETQHATLSGYTSWVSLFRLQAGGSTGNILSFPSLLAGFRVTATESVSGGNGSARLDASGTKLISTCSFSISSSSDINGVADVVLRRRSAANLALGAADAASPVAQTISVQSATGTNTSAASAVFSLDGAQGTGTGAGGDVRIRVAPNGSTGSSQNALVEAVRFRATDLATQCAGAVIAGGPVVLPSFTVGTLPSASLWTRGLIYVSDDVGGTTPAFSDGTNWRRVADRAVVSIP
jgi:hypothetical protein